MIRKALLVGAFGLVLAASAARACAMPPFAEAYAAKCTLCHTEVPTLNSYGRYVQRTGYSVLNYHVLKQALPVWVGVNPSYNSQDPNAPHQLQSGNVAIHAIGYATSDWTYHIQQWITQNNAPGGVDTAWVAYNNLLRRDGHLFFGKILTPAPSPFSQWSDLSSFSTAEAVVGEHVYQLDANRWGSRFAYTHGNLDAEVAWLGSNEGWGGISQFSNSTDKTLQWKLSYANPKVPTEIGFYGSRGSYPLTEGGTDQYYSVAAYAQHDPQRIVPGMFVIYQIAYDANPGNGAGPSASNFATVELYQNLFGKNALIGVRKEFSNDGLGTQLQTGNIDFEYHIARFVHLYLETNMAQHSKPGYRYMVWWTTPLSRPLRP